MSDQDRPAALKETIDTGTRRAADGGTGRMAPGTKIGSCVIEGVLGAGGMGVIYAARDQTLDRRVALKVLSEKLAADPSIVERFRREARSMARLAHLNIVHVYSAGREDEIPHFVMELVEGHSVDQRLERGPIPVPEAVEILRQVTVALQAAHDSGILHRDIKPSNLMLTPQNTVKVLDFGLAKILQETAGDKKLTRSHEIVGSPHYMSPEQAKGRELDKRSDIYSLGATFYHMLAGSPPFDDDSILGLLHKHISESPPPIEARRPDVPPAIRGLLERMLAKDPAQRPQDLGEVKQLLDGVERAPPSPGPDPTPAASPAPETPVPFVTTVQAVKLFIHGGGKLPGWDFQPRLWDEIRGLALLGILGGLFYSFHHPITVAHAIAWGALAFVLHVVVFGCVEWLILRLSRTGYSFRMVLHLERILTALTLPFLLVNTPKVACVLIFALRFRAFSTHPSGGVPSAIMASFIGILITVKLMALGIDPTGANSPPGHARTAPGAMHTPGPVPPAFRKLVDQQLEGARKNLDKFTEQE